MRFQPGQSGNPGGRPKRLREVEERARDHTAAALEKLVELMGNPDAKHDVQLRAAVAILDRGWGSPRQLVEHEASEDAPVRFVVYGERQAESAEAWLAEHKPAEA